MAAIMTALKGAAPTTINSVTVTSFDYPVETVTPPAVIVGYPTTIDYDATFARGADRAVFPVWFVCGRVVDKSTVTMVSAAVSGVGDIKSAIESNATLLTVVDTVRVTDATPAELVLSGVPFMSMKFDVEVYA
jgi:hypothetical protein